MYLIGYRAGAVRHRPRPEPKAICEGCGHHKSFHGRDPDDATAKESERCHHHRLHYDSYRDIVCHCLGYIGPEPLPTYLAER